MRILIADDDPVSHRLLSAMLQEQGHEIIETSDGSQAWRMLQTEQATSLLILDVMMPGMDGQGYPLGLTHQEIPLECRILSIVDSFDAMTSNRPYQGPISPSQAIQKLKRCAGTQFDPELVEIFIGTVLSDSPGTDHEHDTKADGQETCDQGSPSH